MPLTIAEHDYDLRCKCNLNPIRLLHRNVDRWVKYNYPKAIDTLAPEADVTPVTVAGAGAAKVWRKVASETRELKSEVKSEVYS